MCALLCRGELGFFRIERGVDLLRIEEDCSYAEPDYKMEDAVKRGKYGGSMYGIKRLGVRGASQLEQR